MSVIDVLVVLPVTTLKPYICIYNIFSAMIDGIGGPDRVNNFLATLDMKPINPRTLKDLERKAGTAIEAFSKESQLKSAKEAMHLEQQ